MRRKKSIKITTVFYYIHNPCCCYYYYYYHISILVKIVIIYIMSNQFQRKWLAEFGYHTAQAINIFKSQHFPYSFFFPTWHPSISLSWHSFHFSFLFFSCLSPPQVFWLSHFSLFSFSSFIFNFICFLFSVFFSPVIISPVIILNFILSNLSPLASSCTGTRYYDERVWE